MAQTKDIRRSVHTIFFLAWPYRLLNFLRSWCNDLVALAPVAVVLVAWSLSPLSLPPPAFDAADDSYGKFLVEHGFAQVSPVIIALLLAVVTLRFDRRSAAAKHLRHNAAVVTRPSIVGLVFLGLLAFADLWFLPGDILPRFGPSIVALMWAGFVRRTIHLRTRLRVPTECGFRPPLWSLRRRKVRRAVRAFQSLSDGQRSADARRRFDTAMDLCGRDARLRAWCVARAIEFDLAANALAEAEQRVRSADDDPVISSEPAVLGAKGQFYLVVGRTEEARKAFDAASNTRTPYRLRSLLYESGAADPFRGHRWTPLRRLALVWNRQFYAVIQDLLARMEYLRRDGSDQDVARRLAYRIVSVVIDLGRPNAYADLSPREARALQLQRAMAEEALGEMLVAQHRYHDATVMFASAMNAYRLQGHRPRSAAAGVAAVVAAFHLSVDGPGHEAKLLDLLLHSLQMLEFDRGRLRGVENRLELVRASDHGRLYHDALDVLCTKVRHHRDRAAELALWLLESIHRSTLGDAIRHGAHEFLDQGLVDLLDAHDREESLCLNGDPTREDDRSLLWTPSPKLLELRAELRERIPDAFGDAVVGDPVDLAELHRALNGRVAMYFDCRQVEGKWQVTVVLTSHLGTHLHRSTITEPDIGVSDRTVSRSAFGLLQALCSPDRDTVRKIHNWSPLDDTNWADLAAAILPPELDETLRQVSASGSSAVLCVVPDGPLCMVPFGALRLTENRMIIDSASVTFLPNLSMLSRDRQRAEPNDPPVVLTHLGPTRFAAQFEHIRPAYVPVLERETRTRGELLNGLRATPVPDLAVISHHGADDGSPYDQFVALCDGGALSAPTAMRHHWPDTVVLGSCWAGHILVSTDAEPFGLPIACMLNGATTVLGGQAPVDNDNTSAKLLAETVLHTAAGDHAATALRAVVLDLLASEPLARTDPPAQWATLMVWSTNPPEAESPHTAPALWTSHAWHQPGTDDAITTQNSVDVDILIAAGHPRLEPSAPAMSAGLTRAFQHARARTANHHAISTLDIFASIVATDAADWTSFLVAMGVGEPPFSIVDTKGPYVDIVLRGAEPIVASTMLGAALRTAEALARDLGDPTTKPAHLVYGMMTSTDKTLVMQWLRSTADLGVDVVDVLADRVFALDLPQPGEIVIRPAPPIRFAPRAGRGRPPVIGADLRASLLRARTRPVLTTGDFMTVLAADSKVWTRLRSPAVPMDVASESAYDGVAVDIGDGVQLVATRVFALAFDAARRIAFHMGHQEMTSLHVAYAILAVRTGDSDALTVFDTPLPEFDRLAPSPERTSAMTWALLPLVPIYLLCAWAAKKGVQIGAVLVVLILIGSTAILHGDYDAPDIAATMQADEQAITASVNESGTTVPAVLLGPLSKFYIQPEVTGAGGLARSALLSNDPPAIRGWYAFILPVKHDNHKMTTSTRATIAYRGGDYPAAVTCQGEMAKLACLATTRLPSDVAPSITWKPEQINDAPNDTSTGARLLSDQALVLAMSGRATVVDRAQLAGIPPIAPGHALFLATRDVNRGHSMLAVTPVVLEGKSSNLPLLGIAFGTPRVEWPDLVDDHVFTQFAGSLANRQVGPISGAQGYLGMYTTSVGGSVRVTGVWFGASADDAGIGPGDFVESVDGIAVHTGASLTAIVRSLQPGDVVRLDIVRNGRHTAVSTALDYRPLGG